MDYMNADQLISETLRQAIAECGVSFASLERETGVLRQSLMKFARGETSLRLDIADKLAAYFGLTLVRKPDKRSRAKSKK